MHTDVAGDVAKSAADVVSVSPSKLQKITHQGARHVLPPPVSLPFADPAVNVETAQFTVPAVNVKTAQFAVPAVNVETAQFFPTTAACEAKPATNFEVEVPANLHANLSFVPAPLLFADAFRTDALAWSFRRDGHLLVAGGRPFILEVFSGSARLTRSFRNAGLDAWGIDWKGGKLIPESPAIILLNLTVASDLAAFQRLLRHPDLIYVHFAPPSGTCSRARGIPLADGRAGPPPLRSETFPLGLPNLAADHPRELPRVDSANTLYKIVCDAALFLITRGVLWSIENPRDSLLWYILKALAEHPETTFTFFQHCAYGGSRPKWTGWLSWPSDVFAPLAATCPGTSSSHVHGAWGQSAGGSFNTALESAYPEQLCESIRNIILKHFRLPARDPLPVIRARGAHVVRTHRPERAAAARQPRGGRARQLLP